MSEGDVWRPPDAIDCPQCRRVAGVKILYGLPVPEVFEAAKNGQVALGGCEIFPDQPEYRCRTCGHEWVF